MEQVIGSSFNRQIRHHRSRKPPGAKYDINFVACHSVPLKIWLRYSSARHARSHVGRPREDLHDQTGLDQRELDCGG